MHRTHPLAERNAPARALVQPLLICTDCNVEMRLFGIETENPKRDLYTFECAGCGALAVRGVQVR